LFQTFRNNLLDVSLLIKANLFITTLLYLLFTSLYNDYTISSLIFTTVATLSSATILYLLFYILLAPLSFIKRASLWIGATIFIIADLALIVDFFIYRIWKFHINAMVLNIIFSPDAADSIQAGIAPFIVAFLIIISLILFEIYILKSISKTQLEIKKSFNSKLNKKLLPLLLIFVLSDKIIYGFANMYAKTEYLEPTKVIPLYQPMDFTGTMEKVFGLKGTPSNKQTLGINANKNLNYPINPIKISNPKPTNIFIFALDATRASIISKDVSPNIFELSQTSSVYTNHVSGGNATRFGIFSLFYGLNAPYWFVFLNAQKGSILFNTLNDLHYQTHIFSSTSTAWPEFTKTVYFDIQDKISDKYEGKPYQKDIQSSDDFTKWIDSVDRDKPIFTGISYLTVNEDDRQILFNRYKNAVNFDDTLVKKMIDKLKEKGLYDNSMIIITADHGQEFYEYGGYGHNSSFNSEQIKVPFIMHLPENKHKVINRLTSHLDVVPTLMSYIGVENDTNDYSNGYSLFDKNYNRKQAYIGNWNNSAVLTEKYTYVFSNLPNKIFENKTYKTDSYELVKDKDTNRQKVTLKVLNENSRFIK